MRTATTLQKPEPAPGPDGPVPVTQAFARGRSAVLLDQEGAVLAFPAATATATQLHFAIRHSSGLIHAAMPSTRLDELQIPDQWVSPSQNSGAGFTVAVDAADGITTGISAYDRAHTLRILADPATVATDLIRPGHVMPIRCAAGGFTAWPRPWELAIDLVAAAGHPPVAVACRLIGEDGDTLDDRGAAAFARHHGLPVNESCRSGVAPRPYLREVAAGVQFTATMSSTQGAQHE